VDRRRFDRVKDRWLCELQINGQKIRGVVLNLSADGLFVNATPPVLAGTDVLVELRSPDGESYSIVGSFGASRGPLQPSLPLRNGVSAFESDPHRKAISRQWLAGARRVESEGTPELLAETDSLRVPKPRAQGRPMACDIQAGRGATGSRTEESASKSGNGGTSAGSACSGAGLRGAPTRLSGPPPRGRRCRQRVVQSLS
jgi:hypothetical protein